MGVIEQGISLILQSKGPDSQCLNCPISKKSRIIAKKEHGSNIQEIDQYCNIYDWRNRQAEVHQTVIYIDENGKPKIRENFTLSGQAPVDCPLPF